MRIAACVTLVLLAGSVLALAWLDWAYPGLVAAWWRGERIYRFFWLRLVWAFGIAGSVSLLLWWMSARAQRDSRPNPVHATGPFTLAFLALFFFARYFFHPLGVQPGSSIWAYWLIAVTAGVLTWPLYRLWGAWPRSTALRRWGWPIVCGMAAIYVSLLSFLSVARQDAFRAHALDLGTMDQAAWNTIRGHILERTPLYRDPAAGSRYENRLLDAKLELIFIPLSALYWLWPDPRVLLIVQTVCLGGGAIPLFLLVHEHTRRILPSVLLSLAYLLYLPLHYVNMADFHPSALMVPLLIGAWRAMRRRQWRQYYLWLTLALCCRIDAAFVALALGAVVAVWYRKARQHGVYTVALAAAWLAVDFRVIVPAIRYVYGPGAGNLASRRFGALGSVPLDVLRTLVTRPAFVLAQLADREKIQAVFDLLVPLGFSPLLAPLALLPALPVLAINLLAESTWQHSIHAHYMAPVIPCVWVAAGEGLAWLSRARSYRWAEVLSAFVLLNTFLVAWVFSPFPPGRAFRWADVRQPSTYEENLEQVIALVPGEASVCAQSDLHPHLSQRRDAALFPRCRLDTVQEAEYVIVDLDPTSNKSPMDYHAFYETVGAWLAREDYGVVAQRGGALLLQRSAPRDNIDAVQDALRAYGRELYRVQFLRGDVLSPLRADEYYRPLVVLRNVGSQSWHSRGQLPVRLSYRWLRDGKDPVLSARALRTDLPHRVAPGHEVRLRAALLTPSEPGTYALEWDVLREGDAWFSDMGAVTSRQTIVIQ